MQEQNNQRFELGIELLVFLALIVPSMLLSFLALHLSMASFVPTAWIIILRNLGLVALISFFLWRNRESVQLIGWNFRNPWKDIGLGILLFIPILFGVGYLVHILQYFGLTIPSAKPQFLTAQGWDQYLLATLLVVVAAFSEETIFRGYLIYRLKALTNSTTLAVIVSSIIFSLGHGYEGSAGVAAVGVMGLLFAIIYLWRKTLVAPMTIHFLQDLLGLVIVPLSS